MEQMKDKEHIRIVLFAMLIAIAAAFTALHYQKKEKQEKEAWKLHYENAVQLYLKKGGVKDSLIIINK
jgi:NO-binding membrane sensor protein with MHYT domain